jgi:hypothetical protein
MRGGAAIMGPYRYTLWRAWTEALPRLLFVLLNPSVADASLDDPTLRRCIRFAQDWGYGSVEMANLYAYRATHPRTLRQIADPVGPLNDHHIQEAAGRADKIAVAWGVLGDLHGRDQAVLSLLPQPLWCLGYTLGGAPRHPLYVRRDAPLLPYPATAIGQA